jgi:hypothetical protein
LLQALPCGEVASGEETRPHLLGLYWKDRKREKKDDKENRGKAEGVSNAFFKFMIFRPTDIMRPTR